MTATVAWESIQLLFGSKVHQFRVYIFHLHHCKKGLWFSTTDSLQCFQRAIGGCGQDRQLRTCTSLQLTYQFKGDLILGDDGRSVPTKLFNHSGHTQHCPRLRGYGSEEWGEALSVAKCLWGGCIRDLEWRHDVCEGKRYIFNCSEALVLSRNWPL